MLYSTLKSNILRDTIIITRGKPPSKYVVLAPLGFQQTVQTRLRVGHFPDAHDTLQPQDHFRQMQTLPRAEILQTLKQQSQSVKLQELCHPVAVIVFDALSELNQILKGGVPKPGQEVDGV